MTSTNSLDELDPIERDLQAVFAAPVPALRFDPRAGTDLRRAPILRRRSVRLGLGVTIVTGAIVTGILWVPAFGGAGTPTVNAQELIIRSGTASASLASVAPAYHMTSVVRSGAKLGTVVEGQTETWFNGASAARTESTMVMAGVEETFGMAAAGGEIWLYRTRGGETLVAHLAHSDRKDGVLADQSVADLLAEYTIPGCQSAVIGGETRVAGRSAWVVEVRPTPATCLADPSRPDTVKVAAHPEELGSATITIDKATEVTLALEKRDGSGAVAYSYLVEAFETGRAAASTGLPYVPPAGARVVEVGDYGAAKAVFSTDAPGATPPIK